MLYIGLVIGAFLGICIGIIILGIYKDLVAKATFHEEGIYATGQTENEALPPLLSSFQAQDKEEWLGDVSR